MLEYHYEYDEELRLEKVLSLRRGAVRVITVTPPHGSDQSFDEWLRQLLETKPLVTMVTEMPYLALDWFRKKIRALGFADSHGGYAVQKYRTPPTIENGLLLYESWGKTEAKILHGGVDFGLEITQTGSAIRSYGLQAGEEIMRSEAGVWAAPHLREHEEKYELARMFVLNLYGALFAENKVLMFFNTKKEKVGDILDYLRDHNLFGDEPTMNEGAIFTEFSVQMSTLDPDLPLAKVRYDLARLGATHIETVPLDSCIPGLDAIAF